LAINQFFKTDEFNDWFKSFKDFKAKARIAQRLDNAILGNFGDVKPVGESVYEMRFHIGAGYRVYYTRHGDLIYWLLIGGDKSTQKRDIEKAIQLAKNVKEILK
jgi:putative addiction module killer protein